MFNSSCIACSYESVAGPNGLKQQPTAELSTSRLHARVRSDDTTIINSLTVVVVVVAVHLGMDWLDTILCFDHDAPVEHNGDRIACSPFICRKLPGRLC